MVGESLDEDETFENGMVARLVMQIQTPTLAVKIGLTFILYLTARLTIVLHLTNLIHWNSFNPIILVVMCIDSSKCTPRFSIYIIIIT